MAFLNPTAQCYLKDITQFTKYMDSWYLPLSFLLTSRIDFDMLNLTTGHTCCTWATKSTGLTSAQSEATWTNVNVAKHNVGFHRFPFSNFMHFLTLFSKFFSPFLHSTCSLSVSRLYLALDEIYHPFRAAIPNSPTRWRHIVHSKLQAQNGVLTLFDALFQRT